MPSAIEERVGVARALRARILAAATTGAMRRWRRRAAIVDEKPSGLRRHSRGRWRLHPPLLLILRRLDPVAQALLHCTAPCAPPRRQRIAS